MEIYNSAIEVAKGIEEAYIDTNKALKVLIDEGKEILNNRIDEYE